MKEFEFEKELKELDLFPHGRVFLASCGIQQIELASFIIDSPPRLAPGREEDEDAEDEDDDDMRMRGRGRIRGYDDDEGSLNNGAEDDVD